ncbi:deoxynucleotidyltransferase terminal-interacting protein 2 [Alligator sinensis]|uniref:Deoxynucleotidyltransferase terminal-interacting protein 2 n=1 Tax=Alligator sinensis TaxID=38654 RepID=A0A1U7RXB0_ALLSI|nr:deoxynucleotidyltransferase terminal-interacting protein 2 [Alligator sinensis]
MTRRSSKVNTQPEVNCESLLEELEDAETKSDLSNPSETQTNNNNSKIVQSAEPVPELQADGDVSEAESNCSTASGLQTPLFIRVTRRRKIAIPYQPDSPAKNRLSKTALPSELSKSQDEDDVSEAESCSSTVSGARMPSVVRTTRSRQSKTKIQPEPVCEAQAEEVSDAESWSSGFSVEPSITTRRITRSMRIKSQAETIEQTEKKVSEAMLEDEKSVKDQIKSQPIITSYSEHAAKCDSDTEQTSPLSFSEVPCKSKYVPDSANVTITDDTQHIFGNDATPNSPKETEKQCKIEHSEKETTNERQFGIIDSSVEECDQALEKETKETGKEAHLTNVGHSVCDHKSLEGSCSSSKQTTPAKKKQIAEYQETDVEEVAQSSNTNEDEIIVDKQSSTASSLQKASDAIDDDHKISDVIVDNGRDQVELVVESSPCISQKKSNEKDSVVSLLNSDESDESENSEVEEVDEAEENLCCAETSNQKLFSNKSLENGSSHGEAVFVIDTEPGLSFNKKYYLEQENRTSDAESKDEESERDEEPSDLEENEEFIDEDEDANLLENKESHILHLSSSIDPGLNIKKLGGLYISFDAEKQRSGPSVVKQSQEKKEEKILQKSIITPDFEKKECVPPVKESLQQLKKQRKAEREKTTGDAWFGMKAPEMTSELKNDLKALKMRASMDPKRFYKKNDRDGLPKYFQVGTVVDTPVDFYHARIPKKQRKKTIVEELLADSEFRRYNKRKYREIMTEKAALAAGKKNRKKKKFHK